MTSHQAPGAQATAYVTEILGKADGAGPEPVRGGCFPQASAGPATRALQMEERYRRQTTLGAGPISVPRPAEGVAGDPLNDWLSRWTGFPPVR